jgi:hypothetical protein
MHVVRLLGRLLDALNARAGSIACRHDLIQQIADHLVTVRRDADFLAGFDQCADHLRSRECLSRTRWALNWQHATRQLRRHTHSGRHR